MSGAIALGGEITAIVAVGTVRVLDPPRDDDALFFQRPNFPLVIGQQRNLPDPEQPKHLGCRYKITRFVRQAETFIGLDRVETLVLQAVGAQLVDQPDNRHWQLARPFAPAQRQAAGRNRI